MFCLSRDVSISSSLSYPLSRECDVAEYDMTSDDVACVLFLFILIM